MRRIVSSRWMLLLLQSFTGGLSGSLVSFAITWAASRYGALALGQTLVAGMLPALALAFVGGAVADRFDARKVLIVALLTDAGVLLLALVWYATAPSAAVFIGLNLALSALGSVFGVSGYVLVPALFAEDELVRVNASLSLADDAAHLTGPLLGAALFSVAGVEGALGVAAALFAAAAIFLLALPPVPRPGAGDALTAGFALAGLVHLMRSPGVRRLVLLFAAVNFFAAAIQVVTPLYAAAFGGAGAYAFLLAAMNLGMTASNLALAAATLRSSKQLIFGSSLLQGLALVGLGRSRALPSAAAFGALNDAMANVGGTVFVAYLQARLPEALLGRIFAAVSTLAKLLTPLGFAAAPWLIEQLGAEQAIAALGVGTVAVVVWVWLWPKSSRNT